MVAAVRAGLAAGTIRLELSRNLLTGQPLIKAEAVDPMFPRRKPRRLFPLADVIVVDDYPSGLRMLADLLEKSDLGDDRLVTVCSECLKASCWQGHFMCDASRGAGTVDKPISELRTLRLEHPDYWDM